MAAQPDPMPAVGGAMPYAGPVQVSYRPRVDGRADAGEVVWAWVAFEEDPSIGKDRPMVLIGRTPKGRLVGLMLSSRDRAGERGWLRLGAGPWDREGRTSWVRLDRLLSIAPRAVRREGAVLPPKVFRAIIDALAADPRMAALLVRRRPGLLTRLRSWFAPKGREGAQPRRAAPGRSR